MHEPPHVESPEPEIYPLPEVAWRILRLTSDLETGSRSLEEVIRLHHAPSEATIDPTLCALVQIADVTCRNLGIGTETKFPDTEYPQDEPDPFFLLDSDVITHICEPVRSMLESETTYFGLRSSTVS